MIIVELLFDYLNQLGIQKIFTVPGAQLYPFLIRASKDSRFEIIIAAHEAGAGFMADGFTRATGYPSMIAVIGGPGANNLTTAAGEIQKHGSSIIILTGNTDSKYADKGGFQADDYQLSQIIQHSYKISNGLDLQNSFKFFPKPIHLSISFDILLKSTTKYELNIPEPSTKFFIGKTTSKSLDNFSNTKAVLFIGEKINPLRIQEWVNFCSMHQIPVATTMEGLGLASYFPENLQLGIFGFAGKKSAFENLLDTNIEALIVDGVPCNERNTFCWNSDLFSENRVLYIISNDIPKDWEKHISLKINEISSLNEFLKVKWVSSDLNYRVKNLNLTPGSYGFSMALGEILKCIKETSYIFLDSGEHRYLGAMVLDQGRFQNFYSASQTAPMGWALGAGVGAAFSNPEVPVTIITGDGCMLMHGFELAVGVKYKLNILVIISNNGIYGSVERRLKNKKISQLPVINWKFFGESIGAKVYSIKSKKELMQIIPKLKNKKGVVIVEIIHKTEEIGNNFSLFSLLKENEKN